MQQAKQTKRLDQSFIIKMIRDFFLVLLALVFVELGIRFAVMAFEFDHQQVELTEHAAQQLASDLKSIMLNSGGPVAARAVFPIIKRNYRKRGLEIAITPSVATILSVEDRYGFTPEGIVQTWPEGRHLEKSVELRAEKFCVSCHIHARVGDVLGTVVVRNYFQNICGNGGSKYV